jgi:peptidoglycan lytic transglycosylase
LTVKRTIRAIAGLACASTLLLGASAANAQTGGTPGGTTTTTEPSAQPSSSPGSWTTYKAATWYGPGFWGKTTSCGVLLQPSTIGVAHRKLPCGTQVTFTLNGISVTAPVIDRGPYRRGYAWDMTKKTAKRVGFLAVGSGPIQATITPPAG